MLEFTEKAAAEFDRPRVGASSPSGQWSTALRTGRGKAVENSLGSREVVELTIRGLGPQHFENAVDVACWVSIGTRDVPSRPTSLT